MRLIDSHKMIFDIKTSVFPQDSFYPRYFETILKELNNEPEVKAIPIDFIDKQIEHYRQLFEEALFKNDDYDEKYRMMVDALTLLKQRWEKYNGV